MLLFYYINLIEMLWFSKKVIMTYNLGWREYISIKNTHTTHSFKREKVHLPPLNIAVIQFFPDLKNQFFNLSTFKNCSLLQ
jgi:hypothetical protein